MSDEPNPASNSGTTTVIVGAGQAGDELASALRQNGYAGRIVLIGDESHAPYRRPPLSKTFLSGDLALESLFIKSKAAYEKLNVEVHLGIGVEAIERDAHRLRLFDGSTLAYDKLALTTGGRPRKLSLPGADKPNVHYVRSIGDIQRMRAGFTEGKRLVIIGGGYIGLEAASIGIKKGLQVTVIEALPRVLARVAAPEISTFYERVHREHGVDLRTGVGVHAFEGDEHVEAIVLADGTRIPADLVIAGIGIIPNTELAEAAGLHVANGIVVDRFARTSDPDIVAAGDCTFHDNVFLGRQLRLESVPHALEHARTAALTLRGKPREYAALPWFWSDQYDMKLQMAGLSQGYDQLVMRGDPGGKAFSVFYLKDGVMISADAVNRPQEFMVAKRLIAERARIEATVLADESVPMKSLLPAPA